MWSMPWSFFLFPLFFMICIACMFALCRRRGSFSRCCHREPPTARHLSAEINALRNEVQALRNAITKNGGI